MKTLKQIFKKKEQKVGIPLNDKEYIQCVKEWLQQKPTIKFHENTGWVEYIKKDELLEDLEQ